MRIPKSGLEPLSREVYRCRDFFEKEYTEETHPDQRAEIYYLITAAEACATSLLWVAGNYVPTESGSLYPILDTWKTKPGEVDISDIRKVRDGMGGTARRLNYRYQAFLAGNHYVPPGTTKEKWAINLKSGYYTASTIKYTLDWLLGEEEPEENVTGFPLDTFWERVSGVLYS